MGRWYRMLSATGSAWIGTGLVDDGMHEVEVWTRGANYKRCLFMSGVTGSRLVQSVGRSVQRLSAKTSVRS